MTSQRELMGHWQQSRQWYSPALKDEDDGYDFWPLIINKAFTMQIPLSKQVHGPLCFSLHPACTLMIILSSLVFKVYLPLSIINPVREGSVQCAVLQRP